MTEKTDNETLLAEGDLVADYLEELLDIADLDGDIENQERQKMLLYIDLRDAYHAPL